MIRELKRLISGRTPREVREEQDREIQALQSEFAGSVQVVQSGNRILQNMSGVIELNRRGHHP